MGIIAAVMFGMAFTFVGAIILADPPYKSSKSEKVKAAVMLVIGMGLLGWAMWSGT